MVLGISSGKSDVNLFDKEYKFEHVGQSNSYTIVRSLKNLKNALPMQTLGESRKNHQIVPERAVMIGMTGTTPARCYLHKQLSSKTGSCSRWPKAEADEIFFLLFGVNM